MYLSKCVKLAYKQFLNLDRMRFCDKAASFFTKSRSFSRSDTRKLQIFDTMSQKHLPKKTKI